MFPAGYFSSIENILNSEGSYGTLKYSYDKNTGKSYALKNIKKYHQLKY